MLEKIKMFVLAHAGGNVWDYVRLFKEIKGIEIIPIELSGDLTKLNENILASIDEYVTEVYKKITVEYNDSIPIILFGHSFGAYITYELSKRFQTDKLKLVIMSGCSPLHTDVNFDVRKLNLVGRTNNVELNETIDLVNSNILQKVDLVSEYRAKQRNHKPGIVNQYTNCCILCGTEDPFAVCNEEWKYYYTAKNFVIEYFEGGHFFWNDHDNSMQKMLKVIQREINKIIGN